MPEATITADQFYATTREVVGEQPEFVYEAPESDSPDEDAFCRYVHTDGKGNNSCGCVVGHVLNRLGVPLEFMKQREGQPASMVIHAYFGFEANSAVGTFADELQYRQDSGMAWGPALERAERYAPIGVAV